MSAARQCKWRPCGKPLRELGPDEDGGDARVIEDGFCCNDCACDFDDKFNAFGRDREAE